MTTATPKLTDKEIRAHLKAQLAEHLASQSRSIRSAHKWMKRLDVAGLGIVVTTFAYALYGSFAWTNVNPTLIPIAWFVFATCFSLMAILFGFHAVLIRAYPPVILPGKPQIFITGTAAVWAGVVSIVGGLVMAGLWIAFAYSTATFNLAMIVPLANILGVGISIAIVISIVYSIYQKISQSQ